MVLGKLPVPRRPTIWITVGQGPTALSIGAGGGCLDIFTLICSFSPLSPSLWETARYRLKYCLKGPLNPKQPTNQSKPILCLTMFYLYTRRMALLYFDFSFADARFFNILVGMKLPVYQICEAAPYILTPLRLQLVQGVCCHMEVGSVKRMKFIYF